MTKPGWIVAIVSGAAMLAQTAALMRYGGLPWWVEGLLWAGWVIVVVRVSWVPQS